MTIMNKKLFMVAVISLFFVARAVAQTSTVPLRDSLKSAQDALKERIEKTKEEFRTQKDGFQQEFQETRRELKAAATATRAEFMNVIETRREELKKALEEKREAFKNAVEIKREEFKTRIEKHRADLKEKLERIRDERKRSVVEKIDSQLAALNERTLDHFSEALNKLENVLERISGRADQSEEKDVNVSAVRGAIISANELIAAARSAIVAQTGKVYTIEINQENTLRVDVGNARQALHADLVSLRDKVKAARDAAHRAAVSLGQSRGVGNDRNSTSTNSTSTED